MSRQRKTELAGKLRDAAALHEPLAKMAIELIQLYADDAKESLVTAEGEDMLRLQGSARQFTKLHKELTTKPPSITPIEAKE